MAIQQLCCAAAAGGASVLNKWFSMQADADAEDVLELVKKVMEHPEFTFKNPNRLRSVVSGSAMHTAGLHKAGDSGYAFHRGHGAQGRQAEPQVAWRLVVALSIWPSWTRRGRRWSRLSAQS